MMMIRSVKVVAASLLAIASVLAGAITPALAVQVHPFVSAFKIPGPQPTPLGVAVNETTNHVYVVNRAAEAAYEFSASGANVGTVDGPPGFGAFAIAVDNSGGASNGTIYVSDLNNGVQQYSAAGAPTAVRLDLADIPPNGTPQAGGLPNVVNNGEFSARGIAVDSAGNLLVLDPRNKAIDKFSPAGAFIEQIGVGLVDSANLIAVNDAGDVYIAGDGVFALDSSGACINACTPINSLPSPAVAIGPTGNILVTENGPTEDDQFISEYNPAGDLISRSGSNNLLRPFGIAINGSTGNVYVADLFPIFEGTGKIFGPLITLPDAFTESATLTPPSAVVHGSVGADGGAPATCVFQYVTEEGFQSEGFKGASSAPCSPAGPFTGSGLTAVEATLNDLNGGTTYRYRLFATSTVGSNPGVTKTFTTPGPSVRNQEVSALSVSSATIAALVNPNGALTSYHFEYVDQAQYEADGDKFTNATKVPSPDQTIGSGVADVPVSQVLTGLAPGTGYHFRIVAVSPAGQSFGPDATYVTFPPSVGLPDNRAYEQASPIGKNGAHVQGEPNAVQASLAGGGVTFFSNAGIPGGEGAQEFPSYLATRAADGSGWTSQGLLPPASTGPAGQVLGWSEDLADVYLSNKQPTNPSAFYDRSSATRALTTIAEGGKEKLGYYFAASTPDGGTVLFEHISAALAPGAKVNKSNVYVWDRATGKVSTAGVLNAGAQAPAQGAYAGPYDWFVTGDPSDQGGSAASYYTQVANSISDDGSRVFFTAAATGQLYMRVNPTQPQSAVDGEGDCTEPAKACTVKLSEPEAGVVDPNGEQPAAFLGATPDGSTVFFLSSGKLTANATTGATGQGTDLYRYEVSTGDLVDLTPDPSSDNGAEVQGILGMSTDGSRIYFAANGALAPGAAPGNCSGNNSTGACSIYRAEGSTITFVARVEPGGGDQSQLAHDQFNWSPTAKPFGNAENEQTTSRVSPDGQTLLFRSDRKITAYDNKEFMEIYRYRVGDTTPICVSCSPGNAAPTGSATLQQQITIKLTGPRLPFATLTRNLSSDGNRVLFETPDKLVVADVNGVADVYQWEAQGSGTCTTANQNGGCLSLISGGTSPFPSSFADASASGNDVFFFTTQSLVLQDRDELIDVYDARVNGGIPAQNQLETPSCVGEACAGPPSSPTEGASPATNVPGPGNPKRLHCRKGFKKVTKHGRQSCVKAKPRKKGHHGKPKSHKNGGSQR